MYAVAHTFDPVNPTDFDTPNVLIGRYKPHFYSSNHRRPTLFLVDVKAISSPLLGTVDIPPFREKKASRWDQHYLFLIRRKAEWSLAWDPRLPATPKHGATAQDSEQTSPSAMSGFWWHCSVREPCRYPSCHRQPRVDWVPWFGLLLLPGR